MSNPFDIYGPAVISFSGGRTSAFMLRRILDACKGRLRPDVHVMFANTGKERPETLDFVRECQTRWAVPITWLEYRRKYLPIYKKPERAAAALRAREAGGRTHLYEPANGRKERGYVEVTYETASRNGEPFDNMIDINGLPNRASRHCTAEMKIRIIKKEMLRLGYDYWDVVLGLRADEPKRVSTKRLPTKERWEHAIPLADTGVTEPDVMLYWKTSPFDLQLRQHEGNCDVCFLKTANKRARIIQRRPDLGVWWISSEARSGDVFCRNDPPYAKLHLLPVVTDDQDSGIDCFCTD